MRYYEIISEQPLGIDLNNASEKRNKVVDANHKKSLAAQRYQTVARATSDQKRLISASGTKNTAERTKTQDGKLARAKEVYQTTMRSADKSIVSALSAR
jgi:hypothetical protein